MLALRPSIISAVTERKSFQINDKSVSRRTTFICFGNAQRSQMNALALPLHDTKNLNSLFQSQSVSQSHVLSTMKVRIEKEMEEINSAFI